MSNKEKKAHDWGQYVRHVFSVPFALSALAQVFLFVSWIHNCTRSDQQEDQSIY